MDQQEHFGAPINQIVIKSISKDPLNSFLPKSHLKHPFKTPCQKCSEWKVPQQPNQFYTLFQAPQTALIDYQKQLNQELWTVLQELEEEIPPVSLSEHNSVSAPSISLGAITSSLGQRRLKRAITLKT